MKTWQGEKVQKNTTISTAFNVWKHFFRLCVWESVCVCVCVRRKSKGSPLTGCLSLCNRMAYLCLWERGESSKLKSRRRNRKRFGLKCGVEALYEMNRRLSRTAKRSNSREEEEGKNRMWLGLTHVKLLYWNLLHVEGGINKWDGGKRMLGITQRHSVHGWYREA